MSQRVCAGRPTVLRMYRRLTLLLLALAACLVVLVGFDPQQADAKRPHRPAASAHHAAKARAKARARMHRHARAKARARAIARARHRRSGIRAVMLARRQLGRPYIWGGASPSGFDCSGLVQYVYRKLGIRLPHYTGGQFSRGRRVSRRGLRPGDLVFMNGVQHVGIYVGANRFIHAPRRGSVVRLNSLSGWYAAAFVGARRLVRPY